MRSIKIALLSVCFAFLFVTQSFAFVHVEGVYTGFPNNQGIGAAIEVPLLPLFPTYIHVARLNDQKINLPNFTYEGKNFGGDVKFSGYAAELLIRTPINLFGVDLGVNALANLLTGEDQSGKALTLPGNVYAGFFGRYTKDLLPFLAAYLQVGYMFKIVDGEEAVNKKTDPVELDLSDLDMSGLRYGVGLSLGF